jgi:hypothetical protein
VPSAEHRPQGGVAGAERLADRHDVRLDRHLVGREPGAHPSHPGDHLVEAHQEPVLLAPLRQAFPEAVGGRVAGERGGADRLAEERGDRAGTGLLQEAVELGERGLAGRVEASRRRWDVQVVG